MIERNVDRRQQVVDLYRSGLSMRQVAKQIGISRGRVWQILDSEGVERRKPGKQEGPSK